MQNEMISIITNECKKGVFGVSVVTNTEPKMNKRGNDLFGRVRKVSVYTNAVLGVSYENAVNGRLERKGEVADYQSQKAFGRTYYNAFFDRSDKDESVFYLKIGMRANTTIKSTYYVDGRTATAEEMEIIKSFMPQRPDTCKKQEVAGLDAQEQFKVVAPKLENVVRIEFGGRVIE